MPWTTVASSSCGRRSRASSERSPWAVRPLRGRCARPPRGPIRESVRRTVLPLSRDAGSARRDPAPSSPSPRGTWTSASASRGSGDHVRLLAGDGLEHDAVGGRPRCARAAARRAAALRRTLAARRPCPKRGPGSAAPCSASSGGPHEQLAPTSDETGLPGSPKTSVAPRTPNDERLAGPHGDAPEDLLDAELAPRCRARGRAARPRRRRTSRARPPRARAASAAPVRLLRRPATGGRRSTLAPAAASAASSIGAVGLVDLALRRASRPADAAPCRCVSTTHARPARADDLGHAGGGERADLRGAEPRAGRDDLVARARRRRRAAGRWLPAQRPPRISTLLSSSTTFSIGTTASAPSGTTRAGRDRRSPRRRRAARSRAARPRAADDRQRPGRVGRADGEAVHRGARERRQVDGARAPARRARARAPRASGTRSASSGCARARTASSASVDRDELGHAGNATRVASTSAAGYARSRDLGRRPRSRRGAQRRAAARRAARARSSRSRRRGRRSSSTTARPTARSRALTRLHDAHDNVRVVRLRRNFGKAAALAAGFAEATGDVVVTIDGDLQDDPAEIPRLLAKLDEGFDLVSGWKTHRRDPLVAPHPVADLQRGRRPDVRAAPARHELRPQGVPRRGRARAAALRRAAPLHPGARALPRLPRRRAAGQPPAARARPLALRRRALRARLPRPAHRHVRRAATATGRCISSAGSVWRSWPVGGAILVYLTVLKIGGAGDRPRPLLTLGVLLVVVGMQFLSLGLLTELITSHNEERSGERERRRAARRRGSPLAQTLCASSRFGTYQRDYPRNAQVRSCLRGAGVDVASATPRSGTTRETPGRPGRRGCRGSRRGRRGSPPRRRSPTLDALLVGYPGHFDLPAARRAARGRPVVFDPLVSLHDTLVGDRGRFRRRLARRRASCTLSTAAPSARPTSSSPTRPPTPPSTASGSGSRPTASRVCFVGAEDRLFRPAQQPREPFHALFVGKLIPLHGLETILAAARLAPERPVPDRRQRPARARARPSAANVTHVPWIDYERLPAELRAAGCALGIFGTSPKAARVIPNKAFQALACGDPLVTADTAGRPRAAARRRDALLVPPGDPTRSPTLCGSSPPTPALAARIGAAGPPHLRARRERGRARRGLARAVRGASP